MAGSPNRAPPTSVMKTQLFASILAAFLLGTTAFAAAPAASQEQQRFEVKFLTRMIDHHFSGVKMAELCDGRTVHAELQEMCEEIKTAQLAEIATMQGWLLDWYGTTHDPVVDRKSQRQISQLSRYSGAEFEMRFMTMMSMHHAMAIESGAECLLRAYHPEMLNMCAMMIAAQGDEIAQMRLWLCDWHSVCELKTHHRH